MEKNYQEQKAFAVERLQTYGVPREAIHIEGVDQHHAFLWSVNAKLDQDLIVADYNMGRDVAVLMSRRRGKLIQENIGYCKPEGV